MTASALSASDQQPASFYEQVTAALQQGRTAQAEQMLRAALENDPKDARTLDLLGVVLDSQKRYQEAEPYYARALQVAPRSASLLNNVANHYLAQGESGRAREFYRRVVAIDPHHSNANLHLAQMSVDRKQGPVAQEYLNNLSSLERATPTAQLLRAQALYWSGQRSAANQLLRELNKQAPQDPQLAFTIGMTFVAWKRHAEAEEAFTQALASAPAHFDILYNLGLAATRAGHLDRARQVLTVALRQRPNDVDTLFALARVHAEQGQHDVACALAQKALRLAPDRADILLLVAHSTEKLGYYGDAAVAYDRYLKLRPEDDVARRERGFTLARQASLDAGLQDLRWYAQRHPTDAQGIYELGVAETLHERDKALKHLTRAVAIAPNMLPARYARAVLNYQAGNSSESIKDLKFILQRAPRDYRAFDLLGESYLQLGQIQQAVTFLSRAAELAPREPKVLVHYSHALQRLGRDQEAERALAQLKQLGSESVRPKPYSGLLDFLSLPAAEQRVRYLKNLQNFIEMNPQDAGLKVQLAKYELVDGQTEEALKTFNEVLVLTSDPSVLADCGKSLLANGQYRVARDFLQRAVAAGDAPSEAGLDLAIAVFHTDGAQAGLKQLDQTAYGERRGDYYLLRAQMLDSMGKSEEAAESLNEGFRAAPTRADLYLEATLFLIKHKKYGDARALLQQAVGILPDSPELFLTEAITLELLEKSDEATQLLVRIHNRWPEWAEPYQVHGIILAARLKSTEAKRLLETAVALGSRNPEAYYYLALASTKVTPQDSQAAQRAIAQALDLNPHDPYIRSLAGKIAFQQKDYHVALEHLTEALRLWPDMIEAHQTLSATYRALGDKEKSVAELKEVVRIKEQNRSAIQTPPFPAGSLLFSVRANP